MNNQPTNDPIDSILENLTNKYQNKTSKELSQEDLLNKIESDFKNQKATKLNTNHNEDLLFSEIEQKFQGNKKEIKPSIIDSEIDNLAHQLELKIKPKKEINENTFEEIKKEELEQQRRAKAEEKRKKEEAQAKIKKQQELTQKAQIWLKNLNPNSDEGFWFSQFAMTYNSKLEAAIDYLQALE